MPASDAVLPRRGAARDRQAFSVPTRPWPISRRRHDMSALRLAGSPTSLIWLCSARVRRDYRHRNTHRPRDTLRLASRRRAQEDDRLVRHPRLRGAPSLFESSTGVAGGARGRTARHPRRADQGRRCRHRWLLHPYRCGTPVQAGKKSASSTKSSTCSSCAPRGLRADPGRQGRPHGHLVYHGSGRNFNVRWLRRPASLSRRSMNCGDRRTRSGARRHAGSTSIACRRRAAPDPLVRLSRGQERTG